MLTPLRNRRVRAWIALPLLMLLLAACSGESKGPEYTGTITLWASSDLAGHPGRLDQNWLAERVKAYEAVHPSVTVQVRSFAAGEELEPALLTGAELPDLYFGRPLTELGAKRASLPLTPELVSDHHQGALAAFRRGEALTGLPLLLDLQVLALSEQALAARSVPLPIDGRWTVEQFTESLGKLSGSGLFSLGFSLAPGYHQWWALADGPFTVDGAIAPGAEAGLSRLAQWRKAGQLTPDIATLSRTESFQRFVAGQIAMLPVSAWEVPLLRSEPFRASFGVASFPGDLSTGYVYGFTALGEKEADQLAAMADLVTFLAAPDQQVGQARKTGLMPARKSAPNPYEGDPQLTQAFQLRGHFRPLPAGPAWEAAQARIAHELLLALYGGKSPAEALQAARKHLDEATTSAK